MRPYLLSLFSKVLFSALLLFACFSPIHAQDWNINSSPQATIFDVSTFIHFFNQLFDFPNYSQLISKFDPHTGQTKKWHTGHYITFSDNDGFKQQLPTFFDQPGFDNFEGIKLKIDWRTLEPQKDVYNFEYIDQLFSQIPEDKHLFFLILERDFANLCNNSNVLPEYIENHPQYPAESVSTDKKFCAAQVWQQPIMDRYIALFNALADKYDNNPKFEGVITEETANRAISSNQDKQKYLTQFQRLHQETAPQFKQSHVVQTMNFLKTSDDNCAMLRDLAQTVIQYGHGITMPDTNPTKTVSTGQDQCSVYPVYQLLREYKGQVISVIGNDTTGLGDPENPDNYNGEPLNYQNLVKYIYGLAVSGYSLKNGQTIESLGGHYILWNGHFSSREADESTAPYSYRYVQAILDFINQTNHQTISTCPTSITCTQK